MQESRTNGPTDDEPAGAATTSTAAASSEALPAGAALTARDAGFRDDPHPIYDRLREFHPVLADPAYGRLLVTRYRNVRQLLRHKHFGADARRSNAGSYMRRVAGTGVREGAGGTAYAPPLVLSDDPDHRRMRLLMSKAFTPRAVADMVEPIRAVTRELLDAIGTRDEFDFIAEFAAPLPTRIIARMMGIDRRHTDDLKRWSEAILRGYDPERDRETHRALRDAYVGMSQVFHEAVTARRGALARSPDRDLEIAIPAEAPPEDLISAMVRARDEHDRLSDLEIISLCTQLMVAGNVTTTDLMGNGLHALLDAPEQLALLRSRPELIERAVEEMLRFDCPITETARIAGEDGELHGCPVSRGDTLTLSLAAANHDPSVFERPHEFIIERADNPHLGFGSGVHVCLGAPLARLEAQIGISAFLARFPGLRPGSTPGRRRDLPFFRGFESLPVRV